MVALVWGEPDRVNPSMEELYDPRMGERLGLYDPMMGERLGLFDPMMGERGGRMPGVA